ncbi:MAG: hypothetical protein Q8L92_15960, partial [Rubrivivax sp.]|nr:hypothetical protein [Rubrivivax sp.]
MRKTLFSALAAAGLMAACGGGGGADSSQPTSSAARVTLTGVAAKGLMANADVVALAVNADGSVGTTALASTTTSSSGAYTLNFDATAGLPYVIRV